MPTKLPQYFITALILVATLSCTAPVDPEHLYAQCNKFLESNFIDKNDSAETQKGLLQKMTLACERARDDCKKSPEGRRCSKHVKKYM